MIKKLILVFFIVTTQSFSQYNGSKFSFGVNTLFTTTSKVFLFPNSSDEILRNTSNHIDNIFDYGVEFRYRFSEDIILGLNVEYMRATQTGTNITGFIGNSTVALNAEDGFEVIPVELSVYYVLPFSTDNFRFLMGGGGAVYFGNHIRKVGTVEVNNFSRDFAYGVHVSISMQYLVRPHISIQAGLKFRDPDFRVTSQYTSKSVSIGGRIITFPQSKFDSRINVDGVTFMLGLYYDF
ncbi:MAG: hypothetical protein IIA48_06875 [Bacteroidetes bacterium]|nr:hypothetical protein [Bacteroidota bacterium]MCH8942144.1 hypothetical protein [Bacteroidota bacterium]